MKRVCAICGLWIPTGASHLEHSITIAGSASWKTVHGAQTLCSHCDLHLVTKPFASWKSSSQRAHLYATRRFLLCLVPELICMQTPNARLSPLISVRKSTITHREKTPVKDWTATRNWFGGEKAKKEKVLHDGVEIKTVLCFKFI